MLLIGVLTTYMLTDLFYKKEEKDFTKAKVKVEHLPVSKEVDSFSTQALKDYIKQINIRYSKVVYAQAKLESGFNSKMFINNHNLFGLKVSSRRVTTALGNPGEYARYHHWKESVMDYALMQEAYYRECKTEKEYLTKIGSCYAQDDNYIASIKRIIKLQKKRN